MTDDQDKPHIVVITPDGKRSHVLPRKLVIDVIYGERPLSDIENHDEVLRGITKGWLMLIDLAVEKQQLRDQEDEP